MLAGVEVALTERVDGAGHAVPGKRASRPREGFGCPIDRR